MTSTNNTNPNTTISLNSVIKPVIEGIKNSEIFKLPDVTADHRIDNELSFKLSNKNEKNDSLTEEAIENFTATEENNSAWTNGDNVVQAKKENPSETVVKVAERATEKFVEREIKANKKEDKPKDSDKATEDLLADTEINQTWFQALFGRRT